MFEGLKRRHRRQQYPQLGGVAVKTVGEVTYPGGSTVKILDASEGQKRLEEDRGEPLSLDELARSIDYGPNVLHVGSEFNSWGGPNVHWAPGQEEDFIEMLQPHVQELYKRRGAAEE